jgi:regulatory protein
VRLRKTVRPGDANAARMKALRLLERRPHATGELKRKLAMRGFDRDVINAVIERLTGTGLLDDEAFAGNFVRYRLGAAPRGPRRLAAELVARGVDRKLAETTSRAAMGEGGESGLALEAAKKYLKRRPMKYSGTRRGSSRTEEGRRESLAAARERQRAVAWLVRQGFGVSESIKALRQAGVPDAED